MKLECRKEQMFFDMNVVVEQMIFIFGKGYVQEMQGCWEKFQEIGKFVLEFWIQEKVFFESN